MRAAIRAVAAVLGLAVLGFVLRQPLAAWFTGASAPAPAPVTADAGVDHYTCSMHPSVKESAPGTCPICGMDLIPVSRADDDQSVVIDGARRQLLGVRTEPVVSGPMRETLRAVGRVAYDESALTDVNLQVGGWIRRLYVAETGQHVQKGEPLFALYSPEVYAAEQEFLLGLSQGALGAAARRRLELLGWTGAQLDDLARRGKPLEEMPVTAPASGFVVEKDVVQGAAVAPGTRLYRIAPLDPAWIEADVYEADLPRVRPGAAATVTFDYLPGRTFEAKVARIEPSLDPVTRTARVRLTIPNRGLDLRPGMYASVVLEADLGSRVQLPVPAVVYTGPRRLVFVDRGEGRFRPTEVTLGAESDGVYEVLSGVSPGDRVATSGVFLIASEARIRTAARYWDPDDAPDAGQDVRRTR